MKFSDKKKSDTSSDEFFKNFLKKNLLNETEGNLRTGFEVDREILERNTKDINELKEQAKLLEKGLDEKTQQIKDDLQSVYDSKLDELKKNVEKSKASNIGVLSLFAAVISLVLGYFNTALLSNLNFLERLSILFILGLFLLGFIFLMTKLVFIDIKDEKQENKERRIGLILFSIGQIIFLLLAGIIFYMLYTYPNYFYKTTEDLDHKISDVNLNLNLN